MGQIKEKLTICLIKDIVNDKETASNHKVEAIKEIIRKYESEESDKEGPDPVA